MVVLKIKTRVLKTFFSRWSKFSFFDANIFFQHGHRVSQPTGLADQVRRGLQPGLQRHLLDRDDPQVVGLRLLQIHQRWVQRL